MLNNFGLTTQDSYTKSTTILGRSKVKFCLSYLVWTPLSQEYIMYKLFQKYIIVAMTLSILGSIWSTVFTHFITIVILIGIVHHNWLRWIMNSFLSRPPRSQLIFDVTARVWNYTLVSQTWCDLPFFGWW